MLYRILLFSAKYQHESAIGIYISPPFSFFFFFFFCIRSFPDQGWNPHPLQWKQSLNHWTVRKSCIPRSVNGETLNGASEAIPLRLTWVIWCACLGACCYYLCRHHHHLLSNSSLQTTPALAPVLWSVFNTEPKCSLKT